MHISTLVFSTCFFCINYIVTHFFYIYIYSRVNWPIDNKVQLLELFRSCSLVTSSLDQVVRFVHIHLFLYSIQILFSQVFALFILFVKHFFWSVNDFIAYFTEKNVRDRRRD